MIVGLLDETVDGGLEFDNASEYTALQSLLGKFGEEAFDGVGSRARGRHEVEGEARVPVEIRLFSRKRNNWRDKADHRGGASSPNGNLIHLTPSHRGESGLDVR